MPNQEFQHVHIGTGRLGLGFVVYFSKKLGFTTVLCNRQHPDSAEKHNLLATACEYLIKYSDGVAEDTINFHSLYHFGVTGSPYAPLIGAMSNDRTTLITTAVGESQLWRVAPLIAAGVKSRTKDFPLLLVACENGHHCSTSLALKIETHLGGRLAEHGVFHADCIVDQSCDKISINEHASDPSRRTVVVQAESHREWVIAAPSIKELHPLLARLAKHQDIKIISESHLDLYERRKLWLVNGFHLAIAIIGYMELGKNACVADAVTTDDARIRQQIRDVRSELANALLLEDGLAIFGGINPIDAYIEGVEARLKNSPRLCKDILRDAVFDEPRMKEFSYQLGKGIGEDQPISRVLADLLDDCVLSFFAKIKDRLYDPMKKLSDRGAGSSPVALPTILLSIIRFLAEQKTPASR
jgi:mannitol-1-phosphate/altronate dehydrogenase